MTTIIDSRRLRAFKILTQTGSFTRTAVALNRTQSAISHSIAGLEDDLGVRLFLRLGRTIKITDAGSALLVHADAILAEMVRARTSISGSDTSGE
ncbi:MAG: LysR family transcriptional regulator [Opitutaceae bacterium]|jgi:DNA-binding transcriptional LysR family regulator|nr:LysR family transcriptional regulator [Opitutaceae bacterium]